MKKYLLAAISCLLLPSVSCLSQDFQARFNALKASYAGSGNIEMLNDHTLLIQPNMPGPLCALPKTEDGKTTWTYYTFPLASITVPLAVVDETLIGEDRVFTDPGAAKAYKPGDVGDTTMVIIAGVPGKQFHTLTYDRERLVNLPPGPHDSSQYGQQSDNVEAFGLTFADHDSALAFEKALRDAVVLAKVQARR